MILATILVLLTVSSLYTVSGMKLRGAASLIRVISFDVTGTLLVHSHPISLTYAECAVWAKLPNPPSAEELKMGFKAAFKSNCASSPCFGGKSLNDRQWWYQTVKDALKHTGRVYNEEDFNRYFKRVYQHYGRPEAYDLLDDATMFLNWLKDEKNVPSLVLGVTTNAPIRTIDTILPMKGLQDHFKFFVCSQEVEFEKPHRAIFDATFEQAKFWVGPDLQRSQILHIGDSLEADYCGARAAGFQSLLLDRSNTPKVNKYQDWLDSYDYPGKSPQDIQNHTVNNFHEVVQMLEKN